MERMFLLKEVFEGKNLSVELAQAIPESELNCRLIAIHKLPEWEDCEKGIPILLHGEGEKGESNFGHSLKACDSQPSPTPTRQEWEAWARAAASVVCGGDGIQERRFVEALLNLPIIPKE